MTPVSLISAGLEYEPPNVARAIIPSFSVQRNPWLPVGMLLVCPTTSPRLLRFQEKLSVPPGRTPRSRAVYSGSRTAAVMFADESCDAGALTWVSVQLHASAAIVRPTTCRCVMMSSLNWEGMIAFVGTPFD